jgi:hypothetical protein
MRPSTGRRHADHEDEQKEQYETGDENPVGFELHFYYRVGKKFLV